MEITLILQFLFLPGALAMGARADGVGLVLVDPLAGDIDLADDFRVIDNHMLTF